MNKLIKSNIHKDRGILFAFLLIIIISMMLLHVGLFLVGYESSFDKKYSDRDYLEGGSVLCYGDEEKIRDIIDGVSEVEEYRTSKIITLKKHIYIYIQKD